MGRATCIFVSLFLTLCNARGTPRKNLPSTKTSRQGPPKILASPGSLIPGDPFRISEHNAWLTQHNPEHLSMFPDTSNCIKYAFLVSTHSDCSSVGSGWKPHFPILKSTKSRDTNDVQLIFCAWCAHLHDTPGSVFMWFQDVVHDGDQSCSTDSKCPSVWTEIGRAQGAYYVNRTNHDITMSEFGNTCDTGSRVLCLLTKSRPPSCTYRWVKGPEPTCHKFYTGILFPETSVANIKKPTGSGLVKKLCENCDITPTCVTDFTVSATTIFSGYCPEFYYEDDYWFVMRCLTCLLPGTR